MTAPVLTETSTNSAPDETGDRPTSASTLFLLSTLAVGGSERKTVLIVNELRRRDMDVHLAYLNAPDDLLANLSKRVPVICLQRQGKLSAKSIRALRDYIRRAGITKLVSINLYPLIYAIAAASLLPPQQKPSVTLMVNSTEQIDRKARIQMLVYRPLIQRTQAVVFGCQAQLDLWATRFSIDRRKCSIIYNGVDAAKFAPRTAGNRTGAASIGLRLADTDFLIGAVGQLRHEKNHIELITALASLRDFVPGARLLIVGEGPERKRLAAKAADLDVSDRVCLAGQISDVRPALELMDVFVLPSISETFSNAVLEAMSMGKAVILNDTGGSREMVDDGISGFIYNRSNPDQLLSILRRLATERGVRLAIGQRARENVFRRFTFHRMIDDYQHMLGKSSIDKTKQ